MKKTKYKKIRALLDKNRILSAQTQTLTSWGSGSNNVVNNRDRHKPKKEDAPSFHLSVHRPSHDAVRFYFRHRMQWLHNGPFFLFDSWTRALTYNPGVISAEEERAKKKKKKTHPTWIEASSRSEGPLKVKFFLSVNEKKKKKRSQGTPPTPELRGKR